MRLAIKDNQRVPPNPFEKNAICPICNSGVVAKCGKIKMWHWSHKNSEDCDSFGEPETEWHLNWKYNFPIENQEVIVGKHRADVKIKGIVIEVQNSKISQEQIIEREDFYGKMNWVLNGETLAHNFNLFEYKGFYKFKWKWFPKSWALSRKPIYIDLSYQKKDLIESISRYSNGMEHHSTYSDYDYEWEDDYGNIHYDGDYKHYFTRTVVDTERYLKELRNKLERFLEKDLFLIRKLSSNGTGWGKLVSKQKFIEECKNGYYRD